MEPILETENIKKILTSGSYDDIKSFILNVDTCLDLQVEYCDSQQTIYISFFGDDYKLEIKSGGICNHIVLFSGSEIGRGIISIDLLVELLIKMYEVREVYFKIINS